MAHRAHPLPWPDRVFDRIEIQENGCWHYRRLWSQKQAAPRYTTGPESRDVIRKPDGKQQMAYAVIWELLTGQTPPPTRSGMVLFALCADSRCVNPEHRLLCSNKEASRRATVRNLGYDPIKGCAHGHAAEDRYRIPSGSLKCRKCDAESRRKHRLARPDLARANEDRRLVRRRRPGKLEVQVAIDALRFGPIQPNVQQDSPHGGDQGRAPGALPGQDAPERLGG